MSQQNSSLSNQFFHFKKEQFRYNIRKEKLSNIFENKRFKFQQLFDNSENENPNTQKKIKESILLHQSQFLEAFHGNNIEQMIISLKDVRNIVNTEVSVLNESKIDVIILESGLLPILMELLNPKFFGNLPLMEEVFWIFINISTTESRDLINYINNCGIIKICIHITFNHNNEELIHNALWLLGNLVEEENGLRTELMNLNFLEHILKLINDSSKPLNLQCDFAFLLQNFIKIKPYLIYDQIQKYIPIILKYLRSIDDWDLNHSCLTALSNICINMLQTDPVILSKFISDFKVYDGYPALLHTIDKANAISQMVQSEQILVRVTKILGTISCGADLEIQYFLDNGIIDCIYELLENRCYLIRRNSAWILSNFLAGNINQVAIIFMNDKLITKLLLLLTSEDLLDLKSNIAICFVNALQNITEFSFNKLLNKGILRIFFDLIDINDKVEFLEVVLEGIERFLNYGDEMKVEGENNLIVRLIVSFDGLKKLESLQYHIEQKIFTKVSFLIDKFFHEYK